MVSIGPHTWLTFQNSPHPRALVRLIRNDRGKVATVGLPAAAPSSPHPAIHLEVPQPQQKGVRNAA